MIGVLVKLIVVVADLTRNLVLTVVIELSVPVVERIRSEAGVVVDGRG